MATIPVSMNSGTGTGGFLAFTAKRPFSSDQRYLCKFTAIFEKKQLFQKNSLQRHKLPLLLELMPSEITAIPFMLGLQNHLDTVLFLLAKHLVAMLRSADRQPVGDDVGWIELILLDHLVEGRHVVNDRRLPHFQ